MCTVTYFPLKNGALIISNRDEDPARKRALPPAVFHSNGSDIIYPADGLAGGTWIALNDRGDIIVLLNGGFKKHTRKNNYRLSRGIIVKEMIAARDINGYWNNSNLDNIEPFTLIVYSKNKLLQLVWTGDEKFQSFPDVKKAQIWSSVTLYNEKARKIREKVFEDFCLNNAVVSKKRLLDFLNFSMAGNSYDGFIMNRENIVRTCSISTIEVQPGCAYFDYFDLLNNTKQTVEMVFNKSNEILLKHIDSI